VTDTDRGPDAATRQVREITIHEIKSDIRESRYLVILMVLGFTIALAGYGMVTPRTYVATTVLVPVGLDGGSASGGLGALASQYSGLASVAGISLGGGSSKAPEYLAVLQSEYLTEEFVKTNDLLPILFGRKWDAVSKRWKTTDPKKVPTLWAANQYFAKRVRSVTQEKSTGIITVAIKWQDPRQSAQWANALVRMTNDYLRSKAIAESERNIAFLNEEAAKTNVVELKQNIYSLIQREIGNETIAKGREEYALKVLDPAYPPEKPASLGVVALGILGAMVGAILSALFVFVRRIYRSA
jgi:uncharacterized protein involved in exopolysaccharide biosynthesis